MAGGRGKIDPHGGVKFEVGNKVAEKWTKEVALDLVNELIDWISTDNFEKPTDNMFVNEFILMKKRMNPDTFNYLAKKFSSFSELYGMAKKIQEIKLSKYGTADRLNAPITKFVLQNNHNWTDKKDVQQTIKELPKIKFTSE